jgi:hypothetical protein
MASRLNRQPGAARWLALAPRLRRLEVALLASEACEISPIYRQLQTSSAGRCWCSITALANIYYVSFACKYRISEIVVMSTPAAGPENSVSGRSAATSPAMTPPRHRLKTECLRNDMPKDVAL